MSHCQFQADNSLTLPLPSRQQCHSATANSVTAKLTTVSQCHCQADNSCLCPTLLLVSEPLFSYGVKMTKPETFALHQDNCECPMHLALICGTELESHAAFPQLSQSLQDTKQAQFVSVFISLLRWRTLVIWYEIGTVWCVFISLLRLRTLDVIWNRHSLVCVHFTA